MNAYVYDADLYCEECANEIKECILKDVTARVEPLADAAIRRLEKDLDIKVSDKTFERIFNLAIKAKMPDNCDSGEYPCGPYADGGGESDTPSHCGACGEFLENPLTSDGYEYVREAARAEWDAFYDIERGDEETDPCDSEAVNVDDGGVEVVARAEDL